MSDCLSATGNTIFNMRVYQHVKDGFSDSQFQFASLSAYQRLYECFIISGQNLSTCQRLCEWLIVSV